jgi:hypothetical protein
VIHVEHPTPTQDASKHLNPNVVEFKNRRGIKFTNVSDVSVESTTEEAVEAVNQEISEEQPPPEEGRSKHLNTPYGIP